MMEDKRLPKRKYPRLKNYDYSQGGAYFITICTRDRKRILSEIKMSESNSVGWGLAPTATVCLTKWGEIIEGELQKITSRYPFVEIENYIIMPNHIHLILTINRESVGASPHPTVMDIVCAFKSLSTKTCRKAGYEGVLFQRSFYDRIIRSRDEYMEICNYIALNPDNWETDELYN